MGEQKNRRAVGSETERLAAEWLQQRGYHILERNFWCRYGELDLIAEEGGYLCFIEVKYRGSRRCGYPQEALDYRKRQRMTRTALAYMSMRQLPQGTPCRFDAVLLFHKEITVLKNAFDAQW